MSLQCKAAQYDGRLPAWALPPPLMCLHFHPMAVSRWFSAASLKQVSNMAITGSGSLAISLSVFVISAAFLSKGKFFFSWGGVSCACASLMQNCSLHGWSQRSTGEEVVVRLRAKMRTSFPLNLSITFYFLLPSLPPSTPKYSTMFVFCFFSSRMSDYLSRDFGADWWGVVLSCGTARGYRGLL